MFKQIIMPLDGSHAAEKVLRYVVEIGAGFGSRIILTTVNNANDPFAAVENRSYLQETANKIRLQLGEKQTQHNTDVDIEVRTGNPAVEILDFAEETNCDLIALSGRGASGEGLWSLGSVAAKVLQASSIPILLVKKPADNFAPDEKRLVNTILVPLDGSELGEAALSVATELAKVLETKIVLLQVMEPVRTLIKEDTVTGHERAAEYEKLLSHSILGYLKKTKDIVQKSVPEVSVLVREGSPAGQIIDYSATNAIDLIAMSTHGRSGIGRWPLGSVTDKVLLVGEKPVLVVRPKSNSNS
jgi:nucleotide-binding universal stress UspA family protein